MNVVQEVEYVKQEAKIVYLLECLQKTEPPVLIFAEKKQDVDAIHEYLLLKGKPFFTLKSLKVFFFFFFLRFFSSKIMQIRVLLSCLACSSQV